MDQSNATFQTIRMMQINRSRGLLTLGINTIDTGLRASVIVWIIVLFVNAFLNSSGLEIVSLLLNFIILYIPNIIVGCILLVIGMYLTESNSRFVVMMSKSDNFDGTNAETIGQLA